jgi:hypothetical protein
VLLFNIAVEDVDLIVKPSPSMAPTLSREEQRLARPASAVVNKSRRLVDSDSHRGTECDSGPNLPMGGGAAPRLVRPASTTGIRRSTDQPVWGDISSAGRKRVAITALRPLSASTASGSGARAVHSVSNTTLTHPEKTEPNAPASPSQLWRKYTATFVPTASHEHGKEAMQFSLRNEFIQFDRA